MKAETFDNAAAVPCAWVESLEADRQDRVAHLASYFRKCRAPSVKRYRGATYWSQRRNARSLALHYGRLIRKLEGQK